MIIIDTSVWIEFLRNNKKYFNHIKNLLENNKVLTLEIIFSELLQGARNKKEQEIIYQYWINLPKISLKGLMIKAGIYSSNNKLVYKGVGLIDVIILICAIKTKSKIWTLDKKLLNVLDSKLIYKDGGDLT